MKIKITIGDNSSTALILSAEHAALAASLLANATVYTRDGYYDTSGWKVDTKGVRIEYTAGTELEPTHPLVVEAQKTASDANSRAYKAQQENASLQKQIDALTAQLAGIQSVTTCTVSATDASYGVVDAGAPVGNTESADREDLPF